MKELSSGVPAINTNPLTTKNQVEKSEQHSSEVRTNNASPEELAPPEIDHSQLFKDFVEKTLLLIGDNPPGFDDDDELSFAKAFSKQFSRLVQDKASSFDSIVKSAPFDELLSYLETKDYDLSKLETYMNLPSEFNGWGLSSQHIGYKEKSSGQRFDLIDLIFSKNDLQVKKKIVVSSGHSVVDSSSSIKHQGSEIEFADQDLIKLNAKTAAKARFSLTASGRHQNPFEDYRTWSINDDNFIDCSGDDRNGNFFSFTSLDEF